MDSKLLYYWLVDTHLGACREKAVCKHKKKVDLYKSKQLDTPIYHRHHHRQQKHQNKLLPWNLAHSRPLHTQHTLITKTSYPHLMILNIPLLISNQHLSCNLTR